MHSALLRLPAKRGLNSLCAGYVGSADMFPACFVTLTLMYTDALSFFFHIPCQFGMEKLKIYIF